MKLFRSSKAFFLGCPPLGAFGVGMLYKSPVRLCLECEAPPLLLLIIKLNSKA